MAFDTNNKSNVKSKNSTSIRNAARGDEKDHWKDFVQNLHDPVARFNRQLQFIFVNEAFSKLIANDGLEVVGKTVDEAGVPPHIAGDWSALLRITFDTGREGASCPRRIQMAMELLTSP